ncbi:MAG: hypothetical protein U9R74_17680 [Pseudomonadota bacterium]|nr:hypothetical protein [Pseudomonadota bacterium]
MRKAIRIARIVTILLIATQLSGCTPHVGVGMSVGIPVGWGNVNVGVSSGGWYGRPY